MARPPLPLLSLAHRALPPCACAARSSSVASRYAPSVLVARRRRAARAVALVARAPRALVLRELRALRAAILVSRASRIEETLIQGVGKGVNRFYWFVM